MYLTVFFVRTDPHYRPPAKLREDNVFTGVCLFMKRGRVSLVPGPYQGVGYLWSHVPSGRGGTSAVGTHPNRMHFCLKL